MGYGIDEIRPLGSVTRQARLGLPHSPTRMASIRPYEESNSEINTDYRGLSIRLFLPFTNIRDDSMARLHSRMLMRIYPLLILESAISKPYIASVGIIMNQNAN